jgi:hypothetical protein
MHYLNGSVDVIPSISIYNFNKNINVVPMSFPIKFIANDGITLGQIKGVTSNPYLTISKSGNPDIYIVTIDRMSGNVEVTKQ